MTYIEPNMSREPWWTESVAVGDETFVRQVELAVRWRQGFDRHAVSSDTNCLREEAPEPVRPGTRRRSSATRFQTNHLPWSDPAVLRSESDASLLAGQPPLKSPCPGLSVRCRAPAPRARTCIRWGS